MQLNDLNPPINYVLRIQFRYKVWRALIALLQIFAEVMDKNQVSCFSVDTWW